MVSWNGSRCRSASSCPTLRDGERLGACELVFDVEDVRGLHASLAGAVPVEWGPEVYFYGRREFAVRDPDGNLLIFSEPTDDPPTCPEE